MFDVWLFSRICGVVLTFQQTFLQYTQNNLAMSQQLRRYQQMDGCRGSTFHFFLVDLFFACHLDRSWRGYLQSVSCLQFARGGLLQVLSQEDKMRTEEFTNERTKEIVSEK